MSRAWVLTSAFLLIVVFVVGSSQPFQACIQRAQQQSAADNSNESVSAFSVTFMIYRDCLGHFTHDNAEAIIAAFTVILAVSTIALWLTTKRSVDVAERAMTDLERPYVYVFGATGIRSDEDMDGEHHFLLYSVANYGKTPAQIEDVSISVSIGVRPGKPSTQGWNQLIASPILIAGAMRDEISAPFFDKIPITTYADEDTPPIPIPDIDEGKAFFFVVKIRYRGPFTSGHETAACWRWDRNSSGLVLHQSHNYQK